MLVDTFSCVLTFMLVELYFSRAVVKYSIYKYRLPSIQPLLLFFCFNDSSQTF